MSDSPARPNQSAGHSQAGENPERPGNRTESDRPCDSSAAPATHAIDTAADLDEALWQRLHVALADDEDDGRRYLRKWF